MLSSAFVATPTAVLQSEYVNQEKNDFFPQRLQYITLFINGKEKKREKKTHCNIKQFFFFVFVCQGLNFLVLVVKTAAVKALLKNSLH